MVITSAEVFRALHREGIFIMPNPWDAGTARLLESRGFQALATTSSGHAARLGRLDQSVTLDELITHVQEIIGAVKVPINVDAERCFSEELSGIRENVLRIASAGAAGCSIEDYNPATGTVDPFDLATERVTVAAAAARETGLVLTARAENYLYGHNDLDDTIARLCSFRDAGAEVVYPPGLTSLDDIARVVSQVGIPVNVLALRGGPSVAELASVGVRRVSTGGSLMRAAFGAVSRAADELLTRGTSSYISAALPTREIVAAFADRQET